MPDNVNQILVDKSFNDISKIEIIPNLKKNIRVFVGPYFFDIN